MSDFEIKCCHCAEFIPDKIGSGQGIGECKIYNASPNKQTFLKLGKAIFWGGQGGRERNCGFFKEKIV